MARRNRQCQCGGYPAQGFTEDRKCFLAVGQRTKNVHIAMRSGELHRPTTNTRNTMVEGEAKSTAGENRHIFIQVGALNPRTQYACGG
jgi:hypothetical protein